MDRNTTRIRVATAPPYEVWVGSGILGDFCDLVKETRVALVCEVAVHACHGPRVERALKAAGKETCVYLFSGGEGSKTLTTYGSLLERLSLDAFDRQGAVLSLGGGVTSDLAGFVAATYLRGVAFYSLPTSLLAMMDASVGGKTGVNLPQGKNLVGAFWQPRAVGIDVDMLRTLSEREFRQGAVELFKHGLLADESILDDVKNPEFTPQGDADFLSSLVARSVRVKADVVAADPFERGVRAHLNLGHTLGHALEAATKHRLGHGDAVAYGLLFNAHLATQRGFADETERVKEFLNWLQPAPLELDDFTNLEPYLKRDKKAHSGKVKYVLLEAVGKPVMVDDVSEKELAAAWKALKETPEVTP